MGGDDNDNKFAAAAADEDDGYDEFLSILDAPSPPPDSSLEPTKPKPNHKFGHQESDRTQPLSFSEFSDDDVLISENADDDFIVYTDEELDAMRRVRTKLLEEHGIPSARVGSAFLAVATINCKLRVDETASKILKLLEIMSQLGCPDGINDELFKPEAKHELHPYPPVGRDKRGCRTTWIRGGGRVTKENERAHCHACIMQYLSVHADPNTLRNGVSFIIDLSSRNDDLVTQSKQGNEKLIQSFYQAIPQRPQIIMIAGCSLPTRVIVNTSIRLASVFIKQKILQRIHFVTIEEATRSLPKESAPAYVGGLGGGVEYYEKWARERLERLPKPDL